MLPVETLTLRERQVAEYIPSNLTNKEIAHKLGVHECAIKRQLNNIYRKFGVRGTHARRRLIRLFSRRATM